MGLRFGVQILFKMAQEIAAVGLLEPQYMNNGTNNPLWSHYQKQPFKLSLVTWFVLSNSMAIPTMYNTSSYCVGACMKEFNHCNHFNEVVLLSSLSVTVIDA